MSALASYRRFVSPATENKMEQLREGETEPTVSLCDAISAVAQLPLDFHQDRVKRSHDHPRVLQLAGLQS